MADNVTFQTTTLASPPSGTIVSADQDSGDNSLLQRMKLAYSADGVATHVQADADGLLVNLGSNNDVTLATLPDTAAGDLAAINTAVSGTLTVGSHAVTNAGTFAVQVDGAALTALQLIDDIIYVDDADWTDGASKHALVGGLYQSVPQTITDGDVGPLQVDSNGNIIESNSAAILADTASMDTNLTTLAGTVAGTEMQVDIVADGADLLTNTSYNAAFGTAGSADTQVRTIQGIASMTPLLVDATGQGDVPVTLAGEAVTISGTVTVDLGANNDVTIDNSSIVLTEDTTHNTGAAGIMPLAVRNDTLAALADTDGDYAPFQVDALGSLFTTLSTPAGDSPWDDTNDALQVNIVAGSASGTEYTEDAAAPANPAGGAVALVRQDTPATLTSTDGDIVAQRATNYGAAFVQVIDSSGNFVNSFSGSGGTSATDDAAFTAGSGAGTPAMGFATSDTVDSGDVGVLAMDTSRNLKVSIEVDNAGIGGGTQYTEDDAAPANPVGTAMLMERDDALGGLTPIEGDWTHPFATAEGALWVQDFNSDAILADTANMDTNLGTIAGAVAGTEMQVDIVSGNVTNAGTFAVQVDGAALTALQLIDDIVYVDDTSTHATGTSKGALIMAAATPTDSAVDANDIGAVAMSTDRRLLVDSQIVGQDTDITIADGGNAITVDAANDGSLNVTIGDSSNTATIRNLAANDALNVAIVDGAGDQITSFGGGTQYAVDDALGATPTGTLAIAIRDDALSALTPVEGDAIGLRVDANGALWTIPSGTVTIQEAAAMDVSAATVTVDNAGTFAVQEDGAALTALQLIDDTVATLGTTTYTETSTKGNVVGAVRNDTLAALANTDNEIAPLQVNASGALYIQEGAALDVSAATVSVDWNGTAPPIGAGTEAAALRVTVATDSTGVLSVDDNGGALTVDAANDGSLNVTIGDSSNTATIRNLAANDALNVAIVDGAGDQITSFGGGTEYTEDDAGAANPVGATLTFVRADSPAALTTTDGDVVGLRGSDYGAGYVTILDGSGNVINSFSGTGGTSHTDDAAFSIGSASSITPVGYLADETTPDSVDEGDVGVARMTLSRKPYAVVTDPTNENNAFVTNDALQLTGDESHDAADAGNPVKVGHKAIAHGSNPTAVAANDRTDWYSNRHGIPWVIGGHPNIVSFEYNTTGAQTNDNILAAIASGTKYVLTSIETTLDSATDVGYRIGFASATLTAEGASGADAVTGIVLSHPGLKDGSGQHKGDGSGIIGIGGDGEELRITCDAPDTKFRVTGTYYTIES